MGDNLHKKIRPTVFSTINCSQINGNHCFGFKLTSFGISEHLYTFQYGLGDNTTASVNHFMKLCPVCFSQDKSLLQGLQVLSFQISPGPFLWPHISSPYL